MRSDERIWMINIARKESYVNHYQPWNVLLDQETYISPTSGRPMRYKMKIH